MLKVFFEYAKILNNLSYKSKAQRITEVLYERRVFIEI